MVKHIKSYFTKIYLKISKRLFSFPPVLKILAKLYFPMEASDSEKSFDLNIACTEFWDAHLYFDS